MPAIDSHSHLFSSERAGLLGQGGTSLVGFSGTVDEVKHILDAGRITRMFAFTSVGIELSRRFTRGRWPADVPAAERAVRERELEAKLLATLERENDYVCRVAAEDARIEPVIFAEPTLGVETMRREVARHVDGAGVRAIKIHPALSFVPPTHDGYRGVFELAEAKSVVVISHGGGAAKGLYDSDVDYCAPDNFVPILDRHPALRLVVSHLAHPYVDRLLDLAPRYPNLYTDLSFVLGAPLLDDRALLRAIRAFGAGRVLFGSDFPYCDPTASLERLLALGLADEEVEMITWANAIELFGAQRR